MLARLNRLPRLARVILCGAATMMTMPVLSSLGMGIVPLTLAAIVLYVIGWFFWLGFAAELPEVRAGAVLYLLMGIAAFVLWTVYNLVILVLLK